MTLFKRISLTTINMRHIIKFHMRSSRDILTRITVEKSIISDNKFYHKWKRWELMLPKVYSRKYRHKTEWIILKSLDLISWLIRILNLGLLRSTQTLALIAHVLFLTGSSLTWLSNLSSLLWMHYTHHLTITRAQRDISHLWSIYKHSSMKWYLTHWLKVKRLKNFTKKSKEI